MKTLTTSMTETTMVLSSCLKSGFAIKTIDEEDTTEYQQTLPFNITQNNLLTDLSFLGMEYTIFFEIFINKLPTTHSFVNVLLLTKDRCNRGSPRYPGIWVKKVNGTYSEFHITQDMNGKQNDAKNIPVPAANKWIKIGEKVRFLLLHCNDNIFVVYV